jgi:hypothetical protein
LLRRSLTGLLYQPRMIDDECGAVGGMRIGRGNRSSRRKPTPVLLCPPQILHDLALSRTGAAAVGNRRLTAQAMARPTLSTSFPLSACTVPTSNLTQAITFLTCVREVSGSNIGWDTDSPDGFSVFLSPSRQLLE